MMLPRILLLLMAPALLVALADVVVADEMDFYEGRAASTDGPVTRGSSTTVKPQAALQAAEPVAAPQCPEASRNACGVGRTAVYRQDEKGCQVLVRCRGFSLWR